MLEHPAPLRIIGTNEVDELRLQLLVLVKAGRQIDIGSTNGHEARTAGVEACNRRSRPACRSVWVLANMCFI